jgi:HEAT repeat protein
MPDGRVAFVSGPGITVAAPGSLPQHQQNLRFEAGDVAALPDGRLLCTVASRQRLPAGNVRAVDTVYKTIGIVDPQNGRLARLLTATNEALHSPIYLGPRARPPQIVEKADPRLAGQPAATGFLFCQDARFTKNTTAGWANVRAIRVLAGKGLTVRSSHSYIVHAGSEVVELGTVPLAPDGSFFVEVPADTAIAFQAVDAEGRSELNEMSWIFVRPGERRGCIGCHQPRQASPPHHAVTTLATRAQPLRLLGEGPLPRFRGNNAAVTGLMEMQFDRYREVASLNRHAVPDDALGETARLLPQLSAPLPAARSAAATRLGLARDQQAAPALAERLQDGNREARVAAAVALAACGTRQSVPALLRALEDADPLVAQAAAMALENLSGHAEKFNPFAPAAVRAAQVRQWRDWFAANSPEKIAQDLAGRLAAADRDTVRRAAVALGHWGAGGKELQAYVAGERSHNSYPEWRKDHQGDGAMFNSLSPANPRTLQEAVRALGHLRDASAVPLLAETLAQNCHPADGNLFLAEAAAEALGRIGNAAAQAALIQTFAGLRDYPEHTLWYGDHPALIACHAAPVHYFILAALETLRATNAAPLTPHIIRSIPTDPDRALFPYNDDYETVAGRVLRRSGMEAAVVETCLALLGDPQAQSVNGLEPAVAATHEAWGGRPDRENRAAQMLSLTCRNRRYEPRIRAAFERYRTRTQDIPRVFDTGIPVVNRLPVKNWVSFYLARTLGNLGDPQSTDSLIAALEQSPAEGAGGRPDPLGPGVLFLHNELTPCWRAATAWALGRLGQPRGRSVLMRIVSDLENAPDTRHAAAEALALVADRSNLPALQRLAATYPEVSTRLALLRTCASLENAPASR